MKFKRIVIFTMVACMILATPVQAKSAKRVKRSGLYSLNVYSRKGVKLYIKRESDEVAEATKLYKKNKKKFYKEYYNYYDASFIDIKLKKRSITGWGKLRCEKKGKNKKYKFNKYKFKISKNVATYKGYMDSEFKISKKKMYRKIKYSKGTNFYFYVRNGKIRKIVVY